MTEAIKAKFIMGKAFIYVVKNVNYYLKITNLKRETLATIPITSNKNLNELLSSILGRNVNLQFSDLKD